MDEKWGSPWCTGDVGGDVDNGDIYIMMKCVCVTKNEHFLKMPVCLFVMFYGFAM